MSSPIAFWRGPLLAGCPLQREVCRHCSANPSTSTSWSSRSPRVVRVSAKYSTGDGLGDYGGPPVGGLEPRKMWGGITKDPLTDESDYIWKKEWRMALDEKAKREEREKAEAEARKAAEAEAGEGFLSLGRVMALDSLEVDLSQQLLKPTPATLRKQAEQAEVEAMDSNGKPKYKFAPTRNEERYWGKIRKKSDGGSKTLLAESSKPTVDRVKEARLARQRYEQLKVELQLLCLGIGGACSVAAYLTYSNDVAVSYTAGMLGSLVYLRMLGNSVDSMGSSGLANAARGAAGQPRLLVPAVMVLAFNRWNALAADEVGVHLELVPMLVGFFTYKVATLVQMFKELLPNQAGDATKAQL